MAAALYLASQSRNCFAARTNRHEGTKPWDAILVGLLLVAFTGIFVVAALDDGRFHWYPLPWSVCIVGYALLLVGMVLMTWAESVNKFFEPTVRIQSDRGQKVIDTGPYAIVRHPGYASCLPMMVGMALSLGSLWALDTRGGLLPDSRDTNALGRPNLAGRVGRVPRVRRAGSLQVDSRSVVTNMLAALDAHYDEATLIGTGAAVVFQNWSDAAPLANYTAAVSDIQPYEPGEFFKRELPCLLAVLEKVQEPLDLLIVDGYVSLGDRRNKDARLWEALGRQLPVLAWPKRVSQCRCRGDHARRAARHSS